MKAPGDCYVVAVRRGIASEQRQAQESLVQGRAEASDAGNHC